MATIVIKGLEVQGFCGVLAEEQLERQPFEVDVHMEVDISAAAAADDLARTVDYSAVCEQIEKIFGSEKFALVETLATRIHDAVIDHSLVKRAAVEVRKMQPPMAHTVGHVGVQVGSF